MEDILDGRGKSTILSSVSSLQTRFHERPGCHASVAAAWWAVPGAESRSVIPADGCFDLIVKANTDGTVQAFVHEPLARAHLAVVETSTRVFGVRLSPGYGAAVRENRDTLVRSAERWAQAEKDVTDLEAIVVSALDDFDRPPNVIRDFIDLARNRGGAIRLTGERSARGERELQRAARRWLGITPKAYLRIERVRAARTAIRQGLPLASVAADFGYADQAHLTREVRDLLGRTPRQLRPVGILQDSVS
jgi:AraC-like DNA-binding protein